MPAAHFTSDEQKRRATTELAGSIVNGLAILTAEGELTELARALASQVETVIEYSTEDGERQAMSRSSLDFLHIFLAGSVLSSIPCRANA